MFHSLSKAAMHGNNPLTKTKWLATITASLLLTACGGGGSSSGGAAANLHDDGITVTAKLEGTGGTVSPLGSQSVDYGKDVTFTITPDPHKFATANLNCSNIDIAGSDFSDSGTTFVLKSVRNDCSITFSFETIEHEVTANVKDGMFVPLSPADVNGQADFVALDTANGALYAADENGASGSIQAYTFDASGALTIHGSAITAPLAAHCDNSAGNSAPGHCLVVGNSGNAANRVYAIIDDNSGPLIRVYQANAGDLTLVGDVDPDLLAHSISVISIGAIAIDGANNKLFIAAKTKDGSDQDDAAVLVYDIAADGTFTFNNGVLLLNAAAQQLNGIVANTDASHLYVSYDQPSQSEAISDKAGVLHFEVTGGVISDKWTSSFISRNDIKTQDFALTPGDLKAYYIYSYNDSPFGTPIEVKGYTVDGNGDLTDPLTRLSYSDHLRVSMDIADNGEIAYLKGERDSLSVTGKIAIYSIDSTSTKLSYETTAANLANNNVHGLVVDYSHGLAYLGNPTDSKIMQYQVGTDQGTVSPSTQSVEEGTTASVTLTANSGYLGSASGCGDSGVLSGNTYAVTNISADCEIIATFIKQ